MKYRGYEITYNPPPLPTRSMDWEFVHEDFDGDIVGNAASAEECKEEIDDIEGRWYSCMVEKGKERISPCHRCITKEECRDRTDEETE